MPARDFGLEPLLGVLEGRVLLQMHCYRADDMLAMLELASQFGLSVRAFHHAIEAYKIRDVLAERGVGVATWADWWGFKMEAYDMVRENLALLSGAGVPAVLHSDSSYGVQRLNQEAAKALAAGRRAGLPVDRATALSWITLNAAWALGLETVTGSLEAGKMADVVVWSGDPLSVYSRVDEVYVDGRLLYDRRTQSPRPSDFELGRDQASARGVGETTAELRPRPERSPASDDASDLGLGPAPPGSGPGVSP
jgi:imidazolonepropionase-like amidohydrolase